MGFLNDYKYGLSTIATISPSRTYSYFSFSQRRVTLQFMMYGRTVRSLPIPQSA
jgi:hypothetical protein